MNERCMIKSAGGYKKVCLSWEKLHHTEVFSNHIAIVEFGPLEDVLLANNVRVDEQVAVTDTEVLLAGSALEAFQMVDLVPHTHCHLKCSDPLLAGSTETVLAEKPEWMMRCQNVAERQKCVYNLYPVDVSSKHANSPKFDFRFQNFIMFMVYTRPPMLGEYSVMLDNTIINYKFHFHLI